MVSEHEIAVTAVKGGAGCTAVAAVLAQHWRCPWMDMTGTGDLTTTMPAGPEILRPELVVVDYGLHSPVRSADRNVLVVRGPDYLTLRRLRDLDPSEVKRYDLVVLLQEAWRAVGADRAAHALGGWRVPMIVCLTHDSVARAMDAALPMDDLTAMRPLLGPADRMVAPLVNEEVRA